MQQRRPDEPREHPGIYDFQAIEAAAQQRRTRDMRLSRMAAKRRQRLRRTLSVVALLAVILVVGGIYLAFARANASEKDAPSTVIRLDAPKASPATRTAEATPAASAPSADPTSGASEEGAPSETPAPKSSPRSPVEPKDVKVIVWNAAAQKGVAREVGDALEQDRFNVVFFANAPTQGEEQTLIVVKAEADRAAAEAVRDSLGVGTVQVSDTYDYQARVLVIAGQDWRAQVGSGIK